MSGIAVEVSGLGKDFFVRTASGWGRQRLRAVEDVSFQLAKGKTLGLVGESGCGKSTLGRMLVGLVSQTRGEVLLDGRRLNPKRSASDRRGIQMVFQDPYSSLDPRMTIHDIVAEPLRIHGLYDAGRVEKLLDQVGILPDASSRLPSQFSGGQRQRIAIARALALDPRVLILDEAVSALDVSIQAQIVNLLAKLQRDLGLSYLFISHDLSVVRHIAHDVSVMYLGKIVESGLREAVFSRPAHPYTQSLLSAVPSIRRRDRKRRLVLQGELPNPVDKPTGCIFRTRCFKAEARCASEVPVAQALEDGRLVACHFASPIARDQLHTLGALSKSQLVETSREEL